MILLPENFKKFFRTLGTSNLKATAGGNELTMGEIATINTHYPVFIDNERLTKLYYETRR